MKSDRKTGESTEGMPEMSALFDERQTGYKMKEQVNKGHKLGIWPVSEGVKLEQYCFSGWTEGKHLRSYSLAYAFSWAHINSYKYSTKKKG